MSDKSALDKLIESTSSHWPTLTPKAHAELTQLRTTADSYRAWLSLWSHICQRLGASSDVLPNESNFDAMLTQLRTDLQAARDETGGWDEQGY